MRNTPGTMLVTVASAALAMVVVTVTHTFETPCPGSVPALMIQSVVGKRATPSEMDAGLVGFKPVLGGLSQAFEQTQVTLMFFPLDYMHIY
jgi:hypothetical protein